jgi:hypothetical protein
MLPSPEDECGGAAIEVFESAADEREADRGEIYHRWSGAELAGNPWLHSVLVG